MSVIKVRNEDGEFVDIPVIKGDKGDTGDTGPQGATGPQGPAGADGAPGAAATINGVNALTLSATGGLTGSQSGNTYTLSGDALKPVLRTATLTTSGWSSNSQTVTVNGIIADSASQSVDVVPADHNSAKAWGDAGVWCDSQGANTLIFSCESVPTANITLNIRFQEART